MKKIIYYLLADLLLLLFIIGIELIVFKIIASTDELNLYWHFSLSHYFFVCLSILLLAIVFVNYVLIVKSKQALKKKALVYTCAFNLLLFVASLFLLYH